LPTPCDDWRDWFLENMLSFRRTLLMRRDGARLHAGTRPRTADLDRLTCKTAFLVASGLSERDAQMALLTASRFTVGAVLEEQADIHAKDNANTPWPDHQSAFEEGLVVIVDGVTQRVHSRCRPTSSEVES